MQAKEEADSAATDAELKNDLARFTANAGLQGSLTAMASNAAIDSDRCVPTVGFMAAAI